VNQPGSIRKTIRALASGEAVNWRGSLESAGADGASRSLFEALELVDRISRAAQHTAGHVSTSGAQAPLPVGARWGTMSLLEIIGRGSHGIVYRALDDRLNREVAVKLLRNEAGAAGVGRFLDEARLLARVRHPNVVTIHGADVFETRPGLWMERLDGETLHDIVTREGPLDPCEAARVARDTCRGLAAVHRTGVLHRDLKAQNVMRERDGRVVLTDFSTSGLVDDATRLAGTPLCMAPEVLSGGAATERSDVYSAGILLYFLLTGTVPVTGATIEDLRRGHAQDSARALGAVRPDLPHRLETIVSHATARVPSARHASAAELGADLQAFVEQAAHRPRWNPRAAAVLATGALLTAAAVATMWSPRATPGPAITIRRAFADSIQGIWWYGTVSRNGRVLAFGDERGGIALADMRTGQPVRSVVEPGAELSSPVVAAPDGGAVAYAADADAGSELRLARRNKPHQVLLRVPAGDAIASVDWPIADRLAVQVRHPDMTASMHLVNVGTRGPAGGPAPEPASRVVVDLAAISSRISLSPDGRFVAYDAPGADDARGRDVFIVDCEGANVTRLVDDPFDDSSPAWTAGGDRILFISDRTGAASLWSLPMKDGRASGSAGLVQSDLGAFMGVLGVTDDGAYHYLRQVGLVDVYMVTLDEKGRPAGEPRGAAGTFIGSNMNPAFSPDGRTIAFVAQMGTREVLGLRDVERGTARTVSTGMAEFRLPSWSPDGTRLIVKGADTSGRYGLFLLDPQEGRATPLVVVPPDQESTIGAGRWMPDGRAFAYVRFSAKGSVILERQVGSGDEEPLFSFEPDSWPNGWNVTRDGRLVMGIARESGTTFVVAGRDGTREIARFQAGDRVSGPLLMPDGRFVLFTRIPAQGGGEPELWRVAVSGGEPESLGLQMRALRGLDVSPDGRRLAFTSGEPLREPWVIENFLPPAPALARPTGR